MKNVWRHLSESEALKTFHAESRWKLRSEILATASPCATCGVKWVACEDWTKNHRRFIYIIYIYNGIEWENHGYNGYTTNNHIWFYMIPINVFAKFVANNMVKYGLWWLWLSELDHIINLLRSGDTTLWLFQQKKYRDLIHVAGDSDNRNCDYWDL